jgi:phosphatidylinositol alpha-1,6-mannosyltransferase
MLLSVGRLTQRKGLREFVSEVLPRIVAEIPNAMLVVIGDVPHQALHAEGQTPESIQAAADAAGVGAHLKFLGVMLQVEQLQQAYASADVHVFPVRHLPDDPEGFGMVAVEAASLGVPTVAYATGGVVDAVSNNGSGRLVPIGDTEAFARAVVDLLRGDTASIREQCREFAEGFSWDRFGNRLAVELGLGAKGPGP